MVNAGDREAAAERRRLVAALTREGFNATEIGTRLGITRRSVTRIRAKVGVAQPIPRRFTGRETLRALELLDDGVPYAEVARTLGRSDTTIQRHCPGYRVRTPTEASAAAAMGRALARLERQRNTATLPQRKGTAA